MAQGGLAVTLHDVRKVFSLGAAQHLEVLNIAQWALPWGAVRSYAGAVALARPRCSTSLPALPCPQPGASSIGDTDIVALPEAARDRFRAQHIGYIFQTFNLLAPFTALENVLLAMRFATAVPRRQQRQRATELLTRLGLAARLSHKPAQLSRGEQQRVAMARALANSPPLLLADEPCASLDAATAQTVLTTLLAFCRQAHTTLLLVSHDDTVRAGADQVLDLTAINDVAGNRLPTAKEDV